MRSVPEWTTSIVRSFDHKDDRDDGTATREINQLFANAARQGKLDDVRSLAMEVRRILDRRGFDGTVYAVTRKVEEAIRAAQ